MEINRGPEFLITKESRRKLRTHLAQSPEKLTIVRNTHGPRQRETSIAYTWVLS